MLGAWGCGVFGDRPDEVADAFRAHLTGGFFGVFGQAVFAVLDRTGTTRQAFEALVP